MEHQMIRGAGFHSIREHSSTRTAEVQFSTPLWFKDCIWPVQLRFFSCFDFIPAYFDGSYSLTNVNPELFSETMSHGSGGSALFFTVDGYKFMQCCWLCL